MANGNAERRIGLSGWIGLLILSLICISFSNRADAQQTTSGSNCEDTEAKRATLVNRISIYEKRLADAQQELENERALDANYKNTKIVWDAAHKTAHDVTEAKGFDSPESKAARQEANSALEALLKNVSHTTEVNRASRRVALVQRDLDGFRKDLADLDTVKCPAPLTPAQHLHLIIQILKNSGQLGLAETLAATGQQTFGSTDRVDPFGFGIGVGYYFTPWNNSVRIGPFGTLDYLNQTINHTFPAGTYIGTQSHWIATLGAKGGFAVFPSVFLYGLVGLGFLNQDLNINFGGPISSRNTTTPGVTAGLGGEIDLSAVRRSLGVPVSVFFQYQHTWWQDAYFNQPAASPLFNYRFRREDDTIKLGLNFYFGSAPAPAAPPAYPVKALPAK